VNSSSTTAVCLTLGVALASGAARAQCPPDAPTGLTASQGTSCNRIYLNWNDVAGATSYNIYRNSWNSWSTSQYIATSFISQFSELAVLDGDRRYYWVDARRALCLPGTGASNHSNMAVGYAGVGPHDLLTLTASDGTYCGGVMLEALDDLNNAGSLPDTIQFYRNISPIYLNSEEVGSINYPGTNAYRFFDATALPGLTYYYWVRLENACGFAVNPIPTTGYRSTVPGPLNDTCANATTLIPGLSYPGDTRCARGEGPSVCAGNSSPDVWYVYVPTQNGTLHLSTCGSVESFDTCLSVFRNGCTPAAHVTGFNDNGCANNLSAISVPIVAGHLYYVRISGVDNQAGSFLLDTSFTSSTPACYPNCDNSTASPVLNVQDFTCFLQRYAANDSYANCDNSTVAPVLNVQDFTCFLQRYATGCP
jgi:hypothetical protein